MSASASDKQDGGATSPTGGPTDEGIDGQLPFTDQTHYVRKSKIITIFLACSTVDLVALMDQTTLAASLSIVSSSLQAGSLSAWIAGGYFLTSTSCQLLYGRLSDIWSRKTMLMSCIVIFFIGSLASSLAQSGPQLIAFRALTGIGGGGLMTLAQTIVSDVVSLRDRGKYQGILGAVVAIANGIGPIIGASLSSISPEGWRWIFRLNLPLSVITAGAVIFFMPLKKVYGSWLAKLRAIDFLGIFLTLSASTLVVLALTWAGGDYQWQDPHVIAPLIIGVFVMVMFVAWQGYGARYPLMPLHIYKSGLVVGACLTMFINGWLFVVQIYYIPTFFQLVFNLSPLVSGALLLPITLTQTAMSTISGLVVHWVGRYRESIIAGWVVWSIGLGLYSTLDTEAFNVGKAIGYAILTGFGVGQTLQPSLIAIQAGVDRKDMAVVTCTRNFVRNLGSTLGLAVAATLINSSLRSQLEDMGIGNEGVRSIINDPSTAVEDISAELNRDIRPTITAAYAKGFRRVFYLNAALAAFACVLAIMLIPQITLDRSDDDDFREEKAQSATEESPSPSDKAKLDEK